MQQFVFTGAQGSFPVPSGESRVGSDAACQICIRGEGVLPVHAYLRMDGEKLLIRPAESNSSNDTAAGIITINGKKLEGPVLLAGGQEVSIGNVRMRVLANDPKAPGLWSRRWVRISTYSLAGLASLVLLAYLVLVFVILDQGAVTARIAKAISTHLLRDDTEIGSIKINLFDGSADIKELRIKDRYNTRDPFVTIRSINVKLDVWPLVSSWFRQYRNVRITVNEPDVLLERNNTDGRLNIQDILDKYSGDSVALDTGLEQVQITLDVIGGRVVLADNYTPNVGRTTLEDINLRLEQPQAGAPLKVANCQMHFKGDAKNSERGKVTLDGALKVIDESCVIDPAKISSENLRINLERFDLARVFEHLGYFWEPYRSDFKVMLGKPISGGLDVKIANPRNVRLAGEVKSESLIAIKEKEQPPIGNIPMGLQFDVQLLDAGAGYLPHTMDVKLRSASKLDDPSTTHLLFTAYGQLNRGGVSDYAVGLQCGLQDMLNTDIGRRLGLEGRLGGRIQGNAKLVRDPHGRLKVDAKMESTDTYVMVSGPVDPQKPNEPPPLVRQPLPLNFDWHASAEPGRNGGFSHIDIESFALSAPSFVAKSELPGLIKGLDQPGKLEAQAQFKLNLKGREFWTEFAPILALFGFNRPVEELLDLKVTVWGKDDIVSFASEGTAARQWGAEPAPVLLRSVLDYNAKATRLKTNDENTPFLSLILETKSAEGKPLDVRVEALCSRDEKTETIAIVSHQNGKDTGQAGLTVRSDIVTLRERFQPYIEGYLQSWDAVRNPPDKKFASFYANSTLQGELQQTARMTIKRLLNQNNPEPDRLDFELNVSGKNFKVDLPFKAADGKDGAARWAWEEPEPTLALKGSYLQRISTNKEEPNKEILTLEQLAVKGRLGAFNLSVRELDLFKLSKLHALPNQTYSDVLAALTMQGLVNPPAFDFLRSLHVLPSTYPLAGTLALQIAYDRKADNLSLQKFAYKQTVPNPNAFLSHIDVNGALVGIRDLSLRLLPTTADAPPVSQLVAAFIEEGGPAALLDHLGDDLTINQLQLETTPLIAWLQKEYQSHKRPMPLVLSSLLRGDWQPQGTWKAAGFKLTRIGDQKARSWTLLGAQLRNDFTCFDAAPAPGQPRPAAFTFSNNWNLRMGVSLSTDNNIALEGDMSLDAAEIVANLPALKYQYRKPAGEKCKLELADCFYSHGRNLLAQAGRIKLLGKPIEIDVKDFKANLAGNVGTYELAELLINGGPMPCVAFIQKIDPANDAISLRLNAPAADLAYVASLVHFPPTVALTGALKDVSFNYRGSLKNMQAIFAKPVATTQPEKNPALGLNPDVDTLEFGAQLNNVGLQLTAPGDRSVKFTLGGGVKFTSRDLAWKDAAIDMISEQKGRAAIKHTVAIPELHVNSADAKLNLVRAMQSPGTPLDIAAHLNFSTPVHTTELLYAQESIAAALNIAPALAAQQEKFLAGIGKLTFTGSVKTPDMQMENNSLAGLETQNFTLRALKVAMPVSTTSLFGGKFANTDAEYDLSKARILLVNNRLTLRGVKHTQRIKLTDADVNALAPLTAAGGYTLAGRINLQGNLTGTDFGPVDRLSWDGAVQCIVSNLTLQTPPAQPCDATKIPPWLMTGFALGDLFAAAAARAAGEDSIAAAELAKDLPVDRKPMTGVTLALQLYLAKACGVEVERFEFEPVRPTIVINKGIATAEPFQLKGKGVCEGLELMVRNLRINLADQTFADELAVYPLALPPAARTRLSLAKWPADVRDEFLRALTEGKVPLRILGQLSGPTVKFPWPELRTFARRALFGAEKVSDLAALQTARQALLTTWGKEPADLDAAADFADRSGAGLPGTLTARAIGESLIDRVPGLPQSLAQWLSKVGPTLPPRESLRKLLFPEPDPLPGTKPPDKPAPPPQPKPDAPEQKE